MKDKLKLEYEVKGVTLDANDIVKIHEYYRSYIIVEFLLENHYSLSIDEAKKMAADAIHLVDHKDYTESEAIYAIITKNNKKEID